MIYIIRNNNRFGPYDESAIMRYVSSGQVLPSDVCLMDGHSEVHTVRDVLNLLGVNPPVVHGGSLATQLKMIGSELIIPKQSFEKKQWMSDKKLILLAMVGLVPSVLSFVPIGGFMVFYMVSLYFAAIWGLFFYYFFKTDQVKLKTTVTVFFMTQIFVFLIWDTLGLPRFNPFYKLTSSILPLSLLGYVLGVGLTEEIGKAIPLLIIERRAKEPLLPQTMVYYGLMSGIAFGVFEGVQYQMQVNIKLDYDSAFFMNVARLTSLPFLHAIWCGIAGYFTAFANLYPKYRRSLYFLAIGIPAALHGLYDTFCGSLLGSLIALPVTFTGVILLMSYLKQGMNYQSKLRN